MRERAARSAREDALEEVVPTPRVVLLKAKAKEDLREPKMVHSIWYVMCGIWYVVRGM